MSDTLYIVSSAYNETNNIIEFVDEWYPLLAQYGNEKSRLVIINDGSKDDTLLKLKKLEQSHENLVIIDKPNEGHGPSLIKGYQYAIKHRADYIFQTDSDGQTNPQEFEWFWIHRHEYDGIFGHRKVRGDGKVRKFVEMVLICLLHMIFGVRVKDANAPFRLMKTPQVERFLNKMPSDFNLPNVMLTVYFAYYKVPMCFKEITFKPRKAGKNSINMKRISQIGFRAVVDFYHLKKAMIWNTCS